MKKLKFASVLLLSAIAISLTSCKEGKKEEGHSEEHHSEKKDDHDHGGHADGGRGTKTIATFKDANTGAIFEHYINLKEALVKSDPALAATGAQGILETTKNEALKEIANAIASSKDIESQRASFATLTAEIENILEGALASGEVYKQYCPMAFDNTGGIWFSTEKKILNPYFGDKMLYCGTVKETIQ